MYRQGSTTLDQTQSIQKDALISTLKKQLQEYQNIDHQCTALKDQINLSENDLNTLASQKQRIQNDTKIKNDLNRSSINEQRGQLDALKIQLHKCSTHIDDLLRENDALKRTCQNRQNQIAALMRNNQDMDKKNDSQYELNKATVGQIKNLKQDRIRKEQDCEKQEILYEDNIKTLKGLQKQARGIQASINKLQNILLIAEKDHSNLVQQMRTRQSVVQQQSVKLQGLNKDIQDLKIKTSKLQKDCLQSENDYANACNNLDSIVAKNKELTKRLKNSEGALRQTDNQLDKLILERDNHQNQHLQLYNQNKILNEQLDRIIRQILQYEKINQELQIEAENYMKCDQQARTILNRKEIIIKMLETASNKLNKTEEPIAHLIGSEKRR